MSHLERPIYYTLEEEEAHYRAELKEAFVQPVDRTDTYPQKWPLPIDRYRTEWHKPTINLRQTDAASLLDDARNGFKRTGDAAKQKFAFRPAENYIPYNIALANGHPSGKVSITGELMTDEMDPERGGGYVALLHHAPPISKLK